MSSSGMMFIPNFMKIHQFFLRLLQRTYRWNWYYKPVFSHRL